MKKALVLMLVLALAFVFGCASSGKSEVTNATAAQKTEAVNVGKDTATFATIKTSTDYNTPLSGLSNVYSDATSLAVSFMAPMALTLGVDLQATTDCATKSGNTITYNCTQSGGGITGTITINGDNITVDLTITTTGTSAGNQTVKWTGSVTATATLVSGNLKFDTSGTGSSSGTGYGYTFKSTVTYNAVQLDTAGCPIGGSADINVSISVSGGGQSYGQDIDIEAKYGPTCGAVALFK